MEIKITKSRNLKEKPDSNGLGFGQIFSDHMFMMEYNKKEGWHDARIVPYGPLSLDPASTVFHYGAEIFEGLKAYRRPDGKVQLFRPTENIRRMNNSAERLCLPQLDEEFALKAIDTLVKLDEDWVPSAPGTSLYIRPFMFGADPHLGVHAVDHAVFVGLYHPHIASGEVGKQHAECDRYEQQRFILFFDTQIKQYERNGIHDQKLRFSNDIAERSHLI